MLVSWIVYFLNLKGLVVIVDIVCFLLFVVVYMVCKVLFIGDCEMVFVGGIWILLLLMCIGFDMEFFDGFMKMFSKDLDGIGFGEGVVVVLLKFL